jgi:hypothetical protein
MKYIFKSNGIYLGFVQGDYLFSRDGEYLGWIEGNLVWDKTGDYRGYLEGDYILRNLYSIKPVPRVPRVTPVSQPLPVPPVNKVPMILSVGVTDAF